MDYITAYKAAFQAAYPQKYIEVKPKRVRGELRHQVIIDSDKGDILLTEQEMRDATRMFQRGKR